MPFSILTPVTDVIIPILFGTTVTAVLHYRADCDYWYRGEKSRGVCCQCLPPPRFCCPWWRICRFFLFINNKSRPQKTCQTGLLQETLTTVFMHQRYKVKCPLIGSIVIAMMSWLLNWPKKLEPVTTNADSVQLEDRNQREAHNIRVAAHFWPLRIGGWVGLNTVGYHLGSGCEPNPRQQPLLN